MIDSKTAARQLERLAGLDYFPKEAPAKKELRLAIECALTEQIANSVVSDWLAESNNCPKPSEIRRLINARQEAIIEQRRNCPICDGVGFVTIWKLITYRGKSFVIERAETLHHITRQEQANAFMEQMRSGPPTNLNQTVLSAAQVCQCRAVRAQATEGALA